jgi:hypothetical protein
MYTGKKYKKYALGGEGDNNPPLKLYKPKDTIKYVQIDDKRKINPATGKPFKKIGSKSVKVGPQEIQNIIGQAKAQGVNPLTALAVALQETNLGQSDDNLGHVIGKDNWKNLPKGLPEDQEAAFMLVSTLKNKLALAKRLGYDKKGEDFALQAYNGYGNLYPSTEADYHGGNQPSFYEIPVSKKKPLKLSENPAYGKTIISLRDELLKNNDTINELIENTPAYKTQYAMGGLTSNKAKEILRDGTTNGKPLTLKQKKYFGYIAGGGTPKYPTGGEVGEPNPTTTSTTQKLDSKALKKKYASNPYLVGDTNRYYWATQLDREFPLTEGKVRDAVYSAAKANKIDPALLYGSAMEEGMSGAIDDKNWENASEAYVQWSNKNKSKAEQYPVDSFYNYGLDQFAGMAPALVKKGYLPKDFQNNFTTFDAMNEKDEKIKGSAFNTDANALMAKSAMMRLAQDQLEDYLGKTGTKLSDKQKQFFLLANYNGGEGNMQKMLNSYKQKGYLKDDKFLDPTFKPDAYGGIYKNVMARMQAAKMLRDEGVMNDYYNPPAQQQKMATGGEADGSDTGGQGYAMMGQLLPQIGNLLTTLLDKPSYSNQPYVNSQTAKNMTSPYAMGGELDDVDDNQYQEWLQAMFMNQLMSDQGQGDQEDETLNEGVAEDDDNLEEEGNEEFAMGGKAKKGKIYIKPSKRGTFTAAANKHGKSVQAFASEVLANKSKFSPAMVKKANFARNAAKWHHAMGGEAEYAYGGIHINPANKGKFTATKKKTGKTTEELTHSKNPLTRKRAIFAQNAKKWHHKAMGDEIGQSGLVHPMLAAMGYYADGGDVPIEVEGNEIVQTPDGQMQKMQGPSHEEGGIQMQVPEGTKIFSDRLQIEGKTMQQRKMSRERRLKSAQKYLESNPTDQLTKNSFDRTKEIVAREEAQDMALQKAANKIYSAPQKAAYGDEVEAGGTDPWNEYINSLTPGIQAQIPFKLGESGVNLQGSKLPSSAYADANPINTGRIPVKAQTGSNLSNPGYEDAKNAQEHSEGFTSPGGLTTGDYIGLGANLFNAVAPIINTKNARNATKPQMNRFEGFGHEAMEANAKAQGFAGIQAANAKRDIDSATNSAILRNRMGARSVNTQRALDTVADINRNKAIGDINAGYAHEMEGLLGQQAQLANQRDQVVMTGRTMRDERQAQDTDNYYSNMAQNLTNFGTNIGNIGRELNMSQANKDNASLLSAMSEYFDFGRDKNGRLVLKNKSKS